MKRVVYAEQGSKFFKGKSNVRAVLHAQTQHRLTSQQKLIASEHLFF